MIPLEALPGHRQWGSGLPELLQRPEAIWVHGPAGSAVTFLGNHLAGRRQQAFLDDAEGRDPAFLAAWMLEHPRGVLGSHRGPEEAAVAWAATRCISLALPALESPEDMSACLTLMAAEEGLDAALPAALGKLPCPGNLRGLRNRLLRFKLLGQLPEELPTGGLTLPLEQEDMAANLHVLERLLLFRALRRSYGNRVEAAKRLGVSRRQLYLLIARHGDPVRGEVAVDAGPKRLHRKKNGQNSSPGDGHR